MQPFSDEDASIETLSHCSSFSDSTSVADEGKVGPGLPALRVRLPTLLRGAAFVDANPVARCVGRWRSQRGHGPGGLPVQAEGVHRQHSR